MCGTTSYYFLKKKVCSSFFNIELKTNNNSFSSTLLISINSEASKKNADGECDLEGAASIACMEYSKKLDELEAAIKMQKPMLDNMTKMASEIRAVKVGIPVITKSVSSPELKAALAAAQAVSTAKGATSPEAKIAWENVEEIAAASSRSGDMPALLTEECLVDAAREACEAIDELNRVLMLSKSDGDYRS